MQDDNKNCQFQKPFLKAEIVLMKKLTKDAILGVSTVKV